MRAAAGLDADQAWRQIDEQLVNLSALDLPLHGGLAAIVIPMRLKYAPCQAIPTVVIS